MKALGARSALPRRPWWRRNSRRPPPRRRSSRRSVELRLTGDAGTPPRIAVPDLLALSSDRETQDAAKTIGQVLWDDLNFEREFDMIPRDTYKSIPAAGSIDAVPFDRWRELGADGVVIGTVQKTRDRHSRRDAAVQRPRARRRPTAANTAARRPTPGSTRTPWPTSCTSRSASLRGVARTKLTFISDRNREAVVATVEKRDVKEVFIADYDGANQRRITINRTMNLTPNWSPDGRSIAYTSYRTRRARHPDLEHLRRHDGVADERASARTTCRCSRPTARASRSCRIATATPRST